MRYRLMSTEASGGYCQLPHGCLSFVETCEALALYNSHGIGGQRATKALQLAVWDPVKWLRALQAACASTWARSERRLAMVSPGARSGPQRM